ncbi:MAG: sulfatase-like hydrolase/transferase [Planctomycetota bacterium]
MFRYLSKLAAVLLLVPASLAQRVLLIDIDDIGADILSTTPTPNLDRIAAIGLRFENVYTGPLCSPTRQRMNLGAYGSHPDVLLGNIIKGEDGYSMPLEPLEPLAKVVSDAGFSTVKIGKWHLAQGNNLLHPNRAGWQHFAGCINNCGPPPEGYHNFRKVIDGSVTQVTDIYLTTDETDDAISVVQAGVNLVSVSYHAIHKPFHVPPPELYSGPPPNNKIEKARAMLQALDKELGRLVGVAMAQGYVIVVFSDNGTAGPLGGPKGSVWEAAVKMPCFVIGPGIVRGSLSALVGVEDIYATVLDLFSIPGAGDPTRGPHSISFLPLLWGTSQIGGRRWNYTEGWRPNGADPHWLGPDVLWRRGIRDQRYKLVRDQTERGDHFFDLWTDPREQHDLLPAGLPFDQRRVYDTFVRVLDGM